MFVLPKNFYFPLKASSHSNMNRPSLSTRAKRGKSKREALGDLITYMDDRLPMMEYKKLIDEDLVIASGIVEGAARYVIGERMDCGGMRWIPERAEALLRLGMK